MISIILTEDDADDQDFFQDALKDINIPAELLIVHDGAELITTLVETVTEPPPPHLIFLDLNMPRKNGFECIKEIRENPKLKKIPIVVFTTTDNKTEVEKTFNLGANCFIQKPTSHRDLIQLINSALKLKLWETNSRLSKEKYVLTT